MEFINVEYRAAARSAKTDVAVLAGPTRSFAGWALVRIGKLHRAARRYVILRSSQLSVCTTDNPKSQLLTVSVSGAFMMLTPAKHECLIKAEGHKIWIQWVSDSELRVCKAAFEFANRRVEDYYKLVPHRQLGKGRNSEVVFAFDTATGDHAAVKIINKDRAKLADREFAEKEVLIRMTVQHPCIVQTLDIFESPYDLFVVMELMGGGSLDRRMIKQNRPFTEIEARLVMRRLFTALQHLHSRNIVHRNVKPQNIFVDISDEIRWPETAKLSDFSLACLLDDPDTYRHVVGTPEYIAPEASIMSRTPEGEREVIFGPEIDMWAAGVTLYNLLSMDLPYEGDYPPEVFKKARSGKFAFSSRFRKVSPQAISLIKSLLNIDRRKRPTAETVMYHSWLYERKEPSYVDELSMNTNELSLTSKLAMRTESQFRFRVVVLAVRVVHRLITKTPGVKLKPQKLAEKRFQFNVSGINIAPTDSHSETNSNPDSIDADIGAPKVFHHDSTAVMSRISTGSSIDGDSISSPRGLTRHTSADSRPLVTTRMDTHMDYFPRLESRSKAEGQAIRQASFGAGGVGGMTRLLSQKVARLGSGGSSEFEHFGDTHKSNWRWRRRTHREGRPPMADR